MSLINEMQKLLSRPAPIVQGRVDSITGSTLTVISAQGPRRFWVPSTGPYKIGDRVSFQGEVLLGKIAPESAIPSYLV